MKHIGQRIVIAAILAVFFTGQTVALGNVFNLGGTRNADGTWTGLASLVTVPVGDAGNVGESSGILARICGAVDYNYSIGKYEVTAGQYAAFLNAVAATDTYGLYNPQMAAFQGCQITRSGTVGGYTYSVAANYANRPVNWVSWGDATRFANWLHNGQPIGAQTLGTTEDGAYFLNGATTKTALLAINREADWQWALPTEDEWYKAAFYKGGSANAGYWDYPAGSDSVPSNTLGAPADPGNNATYYNSVYTIGSPYYRTEVGAHENSESPYGTYDQGGNVWEWNDSLVTLYGTSYRSMRGGDFSSGYDRMGASYRYYTSPEFENISFGFRVVAVPEPATWALLALGGLVFGRGKAISQLVISNKTGIKTAKLA